LGQQRGRLISQIERVKIIELIDEACKTGACQQASCDIVGISRKTFQRWKSTKLLVDGRLKKQSPPHNKLSIEEQKKIFEIVNKPEYAEMSPAKIVPLLADQGKYIASESTIYRLLRAQGQIKHRQAHSPTKVRKPKPIIAKAANQVYSWAITYLSSSIKGVFFYLYLF